MNLHINSLFHQIRCVSKHIYLLDCPGAAMQTMAKNRVAIYLVSFTLLLSVFLGAKLADVSP